MSHDGYGIVTVTCVHLIWALTTNTEGFFNVQNKKIISISRDCAAGFVFTVCSSNYIVYHTVGVNQKLNTTEWNVKVKHDILNRLLLLYFWCNSSLCWETRSLSCCWTLGYRTVSSWFPRLHSWIFNKIIYWCFAFFIPFTTLQLKCLLRAAVCVVDICCCAVVSSCAANHWASTLCGIHNLLTS